MEGEMSGGGDMKYSIEEIEVAFERWCNDSPDSFITELTRPKWEPQVGEVYEFTDDYDSRFIKRTPAHTAYATGNTRRPLTPDEVPALKVAIEAINEIASGRVKPFNACMDALDKIKELTGG